MIGAGPSGLFAAYYAGFRGMSVAVVDSLPDDRHYEVEESKRTVAITERAWIPAYCET